MNMGGTLDKANFSYVAKQGRSNIYARPYLQKGILCSGMKMVGQAKDQNRTKSAAGPGHRNMKVAFRSKRDQQSNCSDAITYVSSTSGLSVTRLRSHGHQKSFDYKGSLGKQERFNEQFDTTSGHSNNLLSKKNLSNFGKGGGLKATGVTNLNATRTQRSGDRQSTASLKSRYSYRTEYKVDSSSMVRKSVDDHKKNILNVINKLTKEELEKVSDMLRAGGEIPEDQLDD